MNMLVTFGKNSFMSFIPIQSNVYRSVEHHLADVKQRLNYLQQLSLAHQTEYKTFENNLQSFRSNNDRLKQTIPSQLNQITVEDIRTIDVSVASRRISKRKKKSFSNRRFTHCPC